MKRTHLSATIFICVCCLMSCTQLVHHSDPFYNYGYGDPDFPGTHFPLIKPYEVERWDTHSPWRVDLMPDSPHVYIPSSNQYYPYTYIEELEKFAVNNGVIMAYSAYVDKQADPYIQNNFYHWFVIVPNKKGGASGFHTEDEFNQYIQTLDIQNPDWQTPDAAYKKFVQTGCLDWIPDCK